MFWQNVSAFRITSVCRLFRAKPGLYNYMCFSGQLPAAIYISAESDAHNLKWPLWFAFLAFDTDLRDMLPAIPLLYTIYCEINRPLLNGSSSEKVLCRHKPYRKQYFIPISSSHPTTYSLSLTLKNLISVIEQLRALELLHRVADIDNFMKFRMIVIMAPVVGCGLLLFV